MEKFDLLSREELVEFLKLEQGVRRRLEKRVQHLEALNEELKQKTFLVEETYITVKGKLFGRSSEREGSSGGARAEGPKSRKKKIQLPSQRYPDAPLIERHV